MTEKKKKKKVYKEKYYSLKEEEMQALINQAKGGSDKALNELLVVFDNFLRKYVNLLFYGKYNISDYDIRRFVALFVKDPNVRRFLIRNNLNAQGAKQCKGVSWRHSVYD